MKKADFDAINRGCPELRPRYRLKKTTPWQEREGIRVGDEYYYHPNGVMIPLIRRGFGIGTHATKFEFVDYVLIQGCTIVKTGVEL